LAKTGAFESKPWQRRTPEDVRKILGHPPSAAEGSSTTGRTPTNVKDEGRRRTPEDQDRLAAMMKDIIDVPDILSEQDVRDLEQIADLTHAEGELVRLMGIEAETVETEKWNHDAVAELLTLSLAQKKIPFGERDNLFDLQLTADDRPAAKMAHPSRSSKKGKGRAEDTPTHKRSIYHVLPNDAKELWLGQAGAWM
jgi:hypothetical protein